MAGQGLGSDGVGGRFSQCSLGAVLAGAVAPCPSLRDEYFRMKLQWKSVSAEQERRNSLLHGYRSLIGGCVAGSGAERKQLGGSRGGGGELQWAGRTAEEALLALTGRWHLWEVVWLSLPWLFPTCGGIARVSHWGGRGRCWPGPHPRSSRSPEAEAASVHAGE